jgi:hypothetical protein
MTAAARLAAQLAACDKHGLKAVTATCTGKSWTPDARVGTRSPALWGFLMTDEPKVGGFAALANWSAELEAARPELLRYANLLPNYAPTGPSSISVGAPTYDAYIADYIRAVELGLGRIVALHCRPSTLYHIH